MIHFQLIKLFSEALCFQTIAIYIHLYSFVRLKRCYYLVYVGLASRPLPPEGRESLLIYSRVNKSWSSSQNWLPSLDKFLEGIAASHNGLDNPNQSFSTCCSCKHEKFYLRRPLEL